MADLTVSSLMANLTNPARGYLWDVTFSAPIGGGDATAMSARAQSTAEPGSSFEPISINYKQTQGFKVPGRLRMSQTWDCTFIEGEDNAIFTALYNWRQAIVNNTTGVGTAKIKQDVYLNLIATDGTVRKRIRLLGCYPQDVKEVSLTYEGSDTIKLQCTFSYDSWELAA